MSELYDVIIAGAGPVGLFLACELRLAKASVLILERDIETESAWKILPLGRRGLNTVSAEALYRRGLLNDSLDTGERSFQHHKTPGFKYGGNFAGIMVNQEKFDLSRWKYCIPGPTLGPRVTTVEALERVLGERAENLGAIRLRGHAFTKMLSEDEEGVVIEAGEEGLTFRGRWLVGCDGGRSAVRKAAGFDFVGTDANFTGYAAKCDFDHPERLKPGFNVTQAGMYIMSLGSLYLVDYDGAAYDRTQDITLEHLQTVLDRVTGNSDVRITAMHLASTFTDRAKQATTYRRGRVLLAGDAAHIHSPLSGQGLTVGLGDAMNLGWKLGMTVRQERKRDQVGGVDRGASVPTIDLTILDTYQDERHPVGVWVTDWTRAQVVALQPDPFGTAIHSMIREFINTTDGTNVVLDQLWGLSQRYDLSEGQSVHPLVGRSAPDFEFADGSRLGSKLVEGRGLLVDLEDDSTFVRAVSDEHFTGKVDYVSLRVDDRRGLRAFLVRPDGVVAWAADNEDEETDVDALEAALSKWFAF